MNNEYIADGKVKRSKIALDIKRRIITRSDIESLCADPQIKAAFIGKDYKDKKPKKRWNKDYLELLPFAATAESFNRDYLLYLDEVAAFVTEKKPFPKMIVAGVIILLVIIIAGMIVFNYVQHAPLKEIPAEITETDFDTNL